MPEIKTQPVKKERWGKALPDLMDQSAYRSIVDRHLANIRLGVAPSVGLIAISFAVLGLGVNPIASGSPAGSMFLIGAAVVLLVSGLTLVVLTTNRVRRWSVILDDIDRGASGSTLDTPAADTAGRTSASTPA